MSYTLKGIVDSVKAKGYVVYTQPFRLNVVGIRNAAGTNSSFDDKLAVFWYDDKGKLQGYIADGTTDPSIPYLQTPINPSGTAILKSGQYVDTYALGLHRKTYEALVQVKPVTVIRDTDRNSILNFNAKTQTGLFGINIHRAGRNARGEGIIDSASAGCQVFKNKADFDRMITAAKKSRDLYGNKFTYTLLDERDFIHNVSRGTLAVGIVLLAGAFLLAIIKNTP